ncbi:phosphoenolpyruvate--protein phosphotransferase [Larsenimonas rhizosphaerae]|uniref:phosphoenolpyruvate--protein phosphotransferase n=1 Tax=Larsenimonas rhizosphaerae TaxID=2944682 RepID=UPI002033C40E|nr:phosphoenolpyruvate--protein phosphotransferase [Larsenimonas rhizosphaerae]MCM2129968.1 phosphoenolpyruvate--protein phosphotransferase [Larsenimonas rhizosphaerae]
MLTLTQDAVSLGRTATDWRDALTQAGQSLVDAGLAEEGYRDALFDRENQSSTYLGNGIAIPHGTQDSRQYVKKTGVRLLQFPGGVDWHDGARVTLIITIAAQSDEHLDILRSLTHVLDRDGVADQLSSASSPEAVINLLSKEPALPTRLDQDTLLVGLPARDRLELATAAAARLRQIGCVDELFVADILDQTPVALGQKLWLVRSRHGVKQPALGFATSQPPLSDTAGVFCLAEHGDGHVPLMERLIGLLEDGKGEELARVSPQQILARLSGESSDAETAKVRVRNAHGLHARPAKQLVQVAREQGIEIKVRLMEGDANAVSATSLTKVIGLGARRGQMLVFSARGATAAAALDTVVEAVRGGLGEVVTPLDDTSAARPSRNKTRYTPVEPPAPDTALAAVAASPGMAIAPVFVMRLPDFKYEEHSSDAAGERERLSNAIDQAHRQLESLIDHAGGEVAEILSMHEEMVQDPELKEAGFEAIGEGLSAEAGWWKAIDTSARAQEALADRLLAERAADLRDVGRRVLGLLCGVELPEPPAHPYILVMEDVGPSDVAQLDTSKVKGLLTAKGGATSHSAILARALGIPAVVGAGDTVLALANGQDMILDGERGRVIPQPSQERRDRAELSIRERDQRERKAYDARFESAVTTDSHRIEVCANLGNTAHAKDAVERGAEGVGLLRTEFIFMAHPDAPDLDTQISEYREAFDALGHDRPLVARTLDVGGDKPLDYWPIPQEDNPFLGLRGIRLALTRPEVLETQIRALLTAADDRPLRIMFPMVKDVAEFHAAKAIVDRVQQDIKAPDVQVGVMIEIPSCAILAPTLAKHVDFFSIGTNDLTQYTLAIDRGHSQLSAQADGLHPAVLHLIKMTVDAAHAEGRWVGVCGELASDAQAVPVLVGLGVDELSVAARQVPMVKARIRELSMADSTQLAERILMLPTAADVRDALEDM